MVAVIFGWSRGAGPRSSLVFCHRASSLSKVHMRCSRKAFHFLVGTPKDFIAAFQAASLTGVDRNNKHRGGSPVLWQHFAYPLYFITDTLLLSLARASSGYLGSRSEVLVNSKMKRDFLQRFTATKSKRRR